MNPRGIYTALGFTAWVQHWSRGDAIYSMGFQSLLGFIVLVPHWSRVEGINLGGM